MRLQQFGVLVRFGGFGGQVLRCDTVNWARMLLAVCVLLFKVNPKPLNP